jgi:hypothetical protein
MWSLPIGQNQNRNRERNVSVKRRNLPEPLLVIVPLHWLTKLTANRAKNIISDKTVTAIKKVRKLFLPAWYLPNGTINATENELEGASESCERWSIWCGALVIISIAAEFVIAIAQPPYSLFLKLSAVADAGIAIGIVGEVMFGIRNNRIQTELRKRSNVALAAANERAANADLARAELEAKLLPRMLNQEQWDVIQGLRGRFAAISIAYETDAETHWFAQQIRDALFSVGISVAMYPRAADVHSFGTFIFEPNGFDGSRPRTVGPLIAIFGKMGGPLAIITQVPTDVLLSIANARPEMRAPPDAPMIIIGGRFVIPPPHLEALAEAARAARNNINNEA